MNFEAFCPEIFTRNLKFRYLFMRSVAIGSYDVICESNPLLAWLRWY